MTSAVVTGFKGGIGAATASAFEAAGFTVTGMDVHDDPGATFGALDRLDALVCAHGISGRRLGDGRLDACTEEAWDAVPGQPALGVRLLQARGSAAPRRGAARSSPSPPSSASSAAWGFATTRTRRQGRRDRMTRPFGHIRQERIAGVVCLG
jgi:hypothetical protein